MQLTPVPFATLAEMFLQVTERPNDALMQSKVAGAWKALSSAEVRHKVARLSAALLNMGLHRGDRVAILSENSPAWAIADYACISAGPVGAAVFPPLSAQRTPFLPTDTGAPALLVADD